MRWLAVLICGWPFCVCTYQMSLVKYLVKRVLTVAGKDRLESSRSSSRGEA